MDLPRPINLHMCVCFTHSMWGAKPPKEDKMTGTLRSPLVQEQRGESLYLSHAIWTSCPFLSSYDTSNHETQVNEASEQSEMNWMMSYCINEEKPFFLRLSCCLSSLWITIWGGIRYRIWVAGGRDLARDLASCDVWKQSTTSEMGPAEIALKSFTRSSPSPFSELHFC